jgi:hypothetical protein
MVEAGIVCHGIFFRTPFAHGPFEELVMMTEGILKYKLIESG